MKRYRNFDQAHASVAATKARLSDRGAELAKTFC